MKKEEAIQRIQDHKRIHHMKEPRAIKISEALDMTIKTLQVDVVEVVRCRDCEYWKCNPNTKNYGVCRKVSYDDFEVVMESDDFCSYGVRKGDDDE